MPTKNLTTPLDRNGNQKLFKFGGGANTIFTANGYFVDPADLESFVSYTTDYNINTGGGNDIIYGSDIAAGDTLTGGDGDDVIFGGGGDDIINGGNADGSDASKGQNLPPTNFLVGDGVRQPDGTYSTDLIGADGSASNDIINGGDDGSTNVIYGDYSFISVAAGASYTGGMATLYRSAMTAPSMAATTRSQVAVTRISLTA